MPKLLTLSQCFTSFAVSINIFRSAHKRMKLCYVMIDNGKLLTAFQVTFKRTTQSYSPSKISQSVTIKWHPCDREVTNISTLHQ